MPTWQEHGPNRPLECLLAGVTRTRSQGSQLPKRDAVWRRREAGQDLQLACWSCNRRIDRAVALIATPTIPPDHHRSLNQYRNPILRLFEDSTGGSNDGI